MKRRRFVTTILATPAVGALAAQQQQVTQQPGPAQPAPGIPLNPTQPVQPPARTAAMELPKLDPSTPDQAAETIAHFFNPQQMATLRKLSDTLMPAHGGRPGALQTGAPEFLDFLIGQSSAERKQLYRAGLDGLNSQATKKYGKPFGELDATQADALLAPLKDTWTYDGPSDAVGKFLRSAKQDVRTATVNSREYSTASTAGAGARRGGFGGGLYWYPLD